MRDGKRMGWFLTAGFSCAAAVVLLITVYRSLPPGEPAGVSVGESVVLTADGTVAESVALTDKILPVGALEDNYATMNPLLAESDTSDETSEGSARMDDDLQMKNGTVDEMPEETSAAAAEFDTNSATGGEMADDAAADKDPDEIMRVALTFDDGPHPDWTVNLLDGLAERGVRATFFVIGKNIPGNEDIIARMDQEGHLIGNHTYDHVKISDLSVEEACAQVEQTSALVKAITGKDTEYVRPPFGSWREDLECSFEMFPVLWDVDPLDWTTKNTSDVVRRVLEAVEPDDIILLHDCYESSVDAALQIVDALLEQGYEFVTVDELILE
ncbi:MAG: polysaccharide deacetylase family protein [Lachnospiraceae bacterium]|nr:polysaccharide deacetylase family protein [Lachnospiraceae bacterium]